MNDSGLFKKKGGGGGRGKYVPEKNRSAKAMNEVSVLFYSSMQISCFPAPFLSLTLVRLVHLKTHLEYTTAVPVHHSRPYLPNSVHLSMLHTPAGVWRYNLYDLSTALSA